MCLVDLHIYFSSQFLINSFAIQMMKMKSTPLEVTLQAGEFEVIKSIFQTSIPYILGWNTTMDIASAAAMSKGMSGGGNHY